MIAADTSSLSAFFKGETGRDVALLEFAFSAGEFAVPPAVVTEMLSDPLAYKQMLETVANFYMLPVTEGYWHRAGENRRLLKSKNLKAKIADALIAQSCIDHDVPLITRDDDFRHFAKHCRLRLA